MPPRKSKGESGKENAVNQSKSIDMVGTKKTSAKRGSNGKQAKDSKKPRKAPEANDHDATIDAASQDKVGSGRQAAQNLTFQEKLVRLDHKDDKLVIKEEIKCKTEKEALLETEAAMPSIKVRRLNDFAITDGKGNHEPIENLQFSAAHDISTSNGSTIASDLYISGVIFPAEGTINKAMGRRVEKIGPLTSFSIDVSSGTSAIVQLTTIAATYSLLRPATSYKKHFSNLSGQAEIFYEIHQALDSHGGGSAFATLEEVIARLARSKATKGFATPREGLLLNGKFVLNQLARLDEKSGGKAVKFAETEFFKALSKAVQEYKYVGAQGYSLVGNSGIVIRDVESIESGKALEKKANGGIKGEDAEMVDADEEFARQLQAKMDAEARGRNHRPAAPKGAQPYIKVSEAEIADDYPPPASYNKEGEEMDEYLLFDEEFAGCDPEFLPKRILTDFSIYNADGLMAPLELLPMLSSVDPDVELYASGVVIEDDGDFSMSGGQTLTDAGASSSVGVKAAPTQPSAGMRMYLSQIQEWFIEYGADMLFISIRTDIANYRLAVPSGKYAPWFAVVLKAARVAAHVLGMLSEESRASKLSFNDIVKRLCKQEDASSPIFISKKQDVIERFLSVHGQIILNCFQNYPVDAIRRSAFASTLRDHMALVRHSNLYQSSIKSKPRGVNRNPMKDRAAGARSKPMTATATTMVKSIWQAYFIPGSKGTTDEKTGDEAAIDGEVAQEVEEDMNEEENEEEAEENALAEPASAMKGKKESTGAVAAEEKGKAQHSKKHSGTSKKKAPKLEWASKAISTSQGRSFYDAFSLEGQRIALGDAIQLVLDDEEADEGSSQDYEPAPVFGLVQALWQESKSGNKKVQIRVLVRGVDTVLGDAASTSELFLTTEAESHSLSSVASSIVARQLKREWNAARRSEYFKEDSELRARNEDAAKEGKLLEYFWRRQYVPERGMFCDAPKDLKLGVRLTAKDLSAEVGRVDERARDNGSVGADDEDMDESDASDEDDSSAAKTSNKKRAAVGVALENGDGFLKDGITYKVGDYVFVGPGVFDQLEDARREVQLPEYLSNSRFHKGSHTGLRAWGIGRLVKVNTSGSKKNSSSQSKKVSTITVQRFWRPEDISEDVAYRAVSYYDVYAGEEELAVDIDDVVGPVSVIKSIDGVTQGNISTFVCVGSFVRKGKKFGPVPETLFTTLGGSSGKGKATAMEEDVPDAKDKGKGKRGERPSSNGHHPGNDGVALATMDIFAGCGGLSEGMHQAGAAYTKWAIEYERPAADAFKLNNEDAAVFCDNCNVLLHAAMAKAGLESDCLASEEAIQASVAMKAEDKDALPLPGDVDFICGGPPCQGYSGMNRFNKGNWSMVQNSMVMSFLSYADFYRPRYFLLENVRNFVSHNKSFTFRLTVRSLLDMGYQVRFGVLNAGNFGVSQSRKRTFIWAAAPGEYLPSWPKLMHCFRTPQLTINLPGNVQYTAVPQTDGAPLRPVTVREAIGDLPPIENGHDAESMQYSDPPQSAFQRAIRGDCALLTDHISKQMNELNLQRCRCIPKNCPGADWRVLEEIVKQDPSREKFKGQPLVPWCLPNTADRHNGWRGLFGRLDWSGHFPTSTTDPQPMGKVGQVFHPEQDRIVSVRECARAQGFPDSHKFSGTVHNKHRQVGNAVPPPLAAALGRELRKALEKHAEDEAKAALAAQMDF